MFVSEKCVLFFEKSEVIFTKWCFIFVLFFDKCNYDHCNSQTFGIYLSWTCLQIQVQEYFCQGKEIDICENIILPPSRDGAKIFTFYCIIHLCLWSMKTKTMFDKFHSDVYYKLLRLVSFLQLVLLLVLPINITIDWNMFVQTLTKCSQHHRTECVL